MYNGGGFYNQYVGMPEETVTRPTPRQAPRPNPPRHEEPVARPPPRPYPSQHHVPAATVTTQSSNHALIAQLGILAVIALFMFMKLNSS
jgi:hypothetical protein